MQGSINLSVKVALSPELTASELGVYVRGRALLRKGRKAFSAADFKQIDGEGLVRSALERLLELGYVVHRGGGWYAPAKRPMKAPNVRSGFVKKIASTAEQSKKGRAKKDGRYEQLGIVLAEAAEKTLGYKPPKMTYASTDVVNRGCYRRIWAVIDKFSSSVDEFVWFVFEQDWSSLSQVVPSLRLLGSNSFLSSFEGFLQNKGKLNGSDDIFDAYDSAFGSRTARGLAEMRAALRLRTSLEELGATPRQFFGYAAGLRWKAFDGVPPLTFLTSSKFFSQFHTHARRYAPRSGGQKAMYTGYLDRVLSRLHKVPRGTSGEEFENHNWVVAEAIFEPLSPLLSDNGLDQQLARLVTRAADEKSLPTFGGYVITQQGQFTPLAVYWITYAARHLELPFYSPGSGSWKEAVKASSAEQVDLQVLELAL